MKVKSFKQHLENRLNQKEISQIELAAQLEHASFKALQKDISQIIADYMNQNQVGFNDLVKQLGKSPTQVSKMIKGESNLTLATVAQLFSIIGKQPRLTAR